MIESDFSQQEAELIRKIEDGARQLQEHEQALDALRLRHGKDEAPEIGVVSTESLFEGGFRYFRSKEEYDAYLKGSWLTKDPNSIGDPPDRFPCWACFISEMGTNFVDERFFTRVKALYPLNGSSDVVQSPSEEDVCREGVFG